MAVADTTIRVGLRRILFVTDFSLAADAALRYAAALARGYQSTLYLTHVTTPEHWELLPLGEIPHVIDQRRRLAEYEFSKLLKSNELAGIRCEAVLECGDVRRVMGDVVDRYEIDLVIVGTRGRTGFRRLLLGSTAEEILEATSCPVLIVGPKVRCGLRQPDFLRILFVTDLRPEAQKALSYALLLAQAPGTQLVLLHAVEQPPRNQLRDPERTQHYLQAALEGLIPKDADLFRKSKIVVRFGPAVSEIVAFARAQQTDVIVVGEHRPGTVSAHILGDTAHQIVCSAPCPVLTVCSRA